MKMLIITSIKEDMQQVSRIFEQAQIPVYSVSETIGQKPEHNAHLLNNWFARSDSSTSALFFFSFTDDDKAAGAMNLVMKQNETSSSKFPIRAFILPVDACSY